jgi:tetratricopeptide (TPR) repeat protein
MIRRPLFRLHTIQLVSIFLALSFSITLATEARENNVLIIDADRQYDFAESYFKAQDYAEAIGEYRRFLFFFPQAPRAAAALFKIGFSQFETAKYTDAVRTFTEITHKFPDTDWSRDAYFKISESYLKSGVMAQAITTLSDFLDIAKDDEIRDEIYYRMGWIFVAGADWPLAEAAFAKITQANRDAYRLDNLEEVLSHADKLPRKSPKTAGVLAILPGAGHLYCGRPKDALVSFVINAGLILAAVEAFDNDLPILGGVITALELGFYSGNIYSAVNSAHKFNRTTIHAFINQLTRNLKVNLSARPRNNAIQLSLQWSF